MRGWAAALLLIAWASAPVRAQEKLSPAQLESRGVRVVHREFQRAGLILPARDPMLTAAARALARVALTQGAQGAAQLLPVAQVVSDADGADPTPRAVVVRATPAGYALETFSRRTDFNEEPATHLGVGAIQVGDTVVMVALLANRKAVLEAFPRSFSAVPPAPELCGELVPSLRAPSLYLTRPHGSVDRVLIVPQLGSRFCARLSLPAPGRHTVEVVGQGDFGPEVAALFFVDIGGPGRAWEAPGLAEPATGDEARALLLERINGLRAVHGLRPLRLDSRLTRVAQAHSERMSRERFFAHVGPGGEGLRERLRAARYRYSRAGENLGRASGPLAAHFAIEHSPGHRQQLLDPDFTHLGLGITFETVGRRRQVLLTQLLARPGSGQAGEDSEVVRRPPVD